ncbi:fucose permease [Dysgonomonas alginatilytica]|uniref:Fucose permease n=1 Tax=Dysgonomonas alginatilytica TaxID=1605892 RepID=A0A2V3PIQ3_9BACT|nr:MFS transporter [Dysgonomonas alginatilytica]PXV59988.1 fucose permease [Dysgonomonas alginatilytica]
MNNKSNSLKVFIPVMLSFFVMGIVDVVGVSTNYIRQDFSLDDLTASIIPMMVFLWFAIFSIPTGMLMNRIGRKKTVLIAIIISLLSLLLPYLFYNFYAVIIAFALLGIGNTILQVSLNPLVASIVSGEKLASTLTFGQFVKAIASFVGPIIASVAAKQYGDWRLIFVVFVAVSLLAFMWLYITPIKADEERENNQTTFGSTLTLLKDNLILQLFLGIVFIVGIDVCMNTNTPQLLMQRLGMTTDDAALGSSLYFAARTLGAFLGSFILMKCKPAVFLRINMIVAIVAFAIIFFAVEQWLLFLSVALIGFTCANVFSIIFSVALQYKPQQTNEISSLMIMGVAGGAIITPIAGLLSKNMGLAAGFGLLLLCVIYILLLSLKFSKK